MTDTLINTNNLTSTGTLANDGVIAASAIVDPERAGLRLRSATVDVVVPVYNEERALEESIRTLRGYLDRAMPFDSVVTIADNASTDGTWRIATRLAGELDGVRALHLGAKGRGRALRAAWTTSDATVVCYMDVDLSTGLEALLPLVAPLISGHSDIAIGSRLAHGAHIVRGPEREVISRIYNHLLRLSLRSRFSDAQCGFKAMRAEDARVLVPLVRDEEWFFDTELLVLAERHGLRVHEVPVDWNDDPDSRVDIVRTALADLKGVLRLGLEHLRGEDRTPGLAHLRPHASVLSRRQLLALRALAAGAFGVLATLTLALAIGPGAGSSLAEAAAVAFSAGAAWVFGFVIERAARYRRYLSRARPAAAQPEGEAVVEAPTSRRLAVRGSRRLRPSGLA